MLDISRFVRPLCPTWYGSFIILLIICPFIHPSDRCRPPPLRCLIGVKFCQTQQTVQSRPRSAASGNEQPASDPGRLKYAFSPFYKECCSLFWLCTEPACYNGLWWRLLGAADKPERASIIIYPFGGSYFTIWKTPLFSQWELLRSKMG